MSENLEKDATNHVMWGEKFSTPSVGLNLTASSKTTRPARAFGRLGWCPASGWWERLPGRDPWAPRSAGSWRWHPPSPGRKKCEKVRNNLYNQGLMKNHSQKQKTSHGYTIMKQKNYTHRLVI